MKFVVFDTETAGFGNSDSMHSLGWMEVDETFMNVFSSGVMYFAPDDYNWNYNAFKVHGLTREFLDQHADDFEDNLQKTYKLMERANVIGYNTNFDNRFVRNHMMRYGYGNITLNSSHDVMKILQPKYGKMKLGVAIKTLGLDEEAIQRMMKVWFPNSTANGYHNAEYDTCATAMLYLKARAEGLV